MAFLPEITRGDDDKLEVVEPCTTPKKLKALAALPYNMALSN
jgi:hypothetical protein